MVVRGGFFIFVFIIVLSFNAKNFVASTLSYNQKKDMISEAYTSLKGVVESLLEAHTTIQNGVSDSDKDISELEDAKARSEYEVNVMKVEHQVMLAQAAKRTGVTPQEQEDTQERAKAIDEAEKKVGELNTQIQTTRTDMNQLNEDMKVSTLSAESLKKIQDKANEGESGEEHITLPSTADIKVKVDEQLENIQTVIDAIPATNQAVKDEAGDLKRSIETKFATVLSEDSGQTVAQLTVTLKQIDIDLLHLRDLDIYGSAARMEL